MTDQRRVVIAGLNERLRARLREDLETLGYVTWGEASDGRSALTLVRRAQPHLVMLAPPLLTIDGAQLAETMIRSGVAPVVVLDPHEATTGENSVRELSMCAALESPFSTRTLCEAIELAQERFDRLLTIRNELYQLRRDRKSRVLLERTKSLLMRRWQIDEPEAFWRIQQSCLESQSPAVATIQALIEANRLAMG
jgi:AmiR/NasT family two-component response regulator